MRERLLGGLPGGAAPDRRRLAAAAVDGSDPRAKSMFRRRRWQSLYANGKYRAKWTGWVEPNVYAKDSRRRAPLISKLLGSLKLRSRRGEGEQRIQWRVCRAPCAGAACACRLLAAEAVWRAKPEQRQMAALRPAMRDKATSARNDAPFP